MRIVAAFALILGVCLNAAAQEHSATPEHWTYQGKTGPLNWGKLEGDFKACSEGKMQSPIDIHGAHVNKALKPIEFHYLSGPVTIDNNGHTELVTVHPGSYIVVDGVRYDLQQFHFHHPSEESVNGKLADMDAHLVHKSADGKLAVVAVRMTMDQGEANATMATIWEHLPVKTGDHDQITGTINPGGLLPADRRYWTYMGSLTTPPCTENVRWLVMQQTVNISREELRQFSAIYKINSRPLQDAHGRKIEAEEQ